MMKHAGLGWAPPHFRDQAWHEAIDNALAEGRASVARRLLKTICEDSSLKLRSVKIGVLRTFSLELSEDLLALAFVRWGILPKFTWFDFNTFESELLDENSTLSIAHRESPFDFIFLAWRLKDWIPEAWMNPTADSVTETLEKSLFRIEGVLNSAKNFAPVVCYPLNDHPAEGSTPSTRLLQNLLISEHHSFLLKWCLKNQSKCAVIELIAPSIDPKSEAFSRQPFMIAGQVKQSLALAKACAPWIKAPAKVLALDADNTLWGGIVGEDGLRGIQIGDDFPGNLYRTLQDRAKHLKSQGVLLALVSKNDEASVIEVFEANADMPLKLTDFTRRKVNWRDKASNIGEIARELNLGLSSFVFLDDSSFERANVRAMLPEVVVPETPDVLAMLDYLEHGVNFATLPQTAEDLSRSADYEAQKLRDELKSKAQSTEEFLSSLGLVATIVPWTKESLPRFSQLLQKTNQFNLATQRHTLAQIEAWYNSASWRGWVLKAKDRFADQGIVGCALAQQVGADQWEIDSFLLSCRALGRGFETALLSYVVRSLGGESAKKVFAKYLRTDKNSQVRDFYENHGAIVISKENDKHEYAFTLSELPSKLGFPSWIQLLESEGK